MPPYLTPSPSPGVLWDPHSPGSVILPKAGGVGEDSDSERLAGLCPSRLLLPSVKSAEGWPLKKQRLEG